jgi:hypothetical protein
MTAIVPYSKAIVPFSGQQIELAASNLRDFLKVIARYQILEEVSDFEQRYTGAEQEAVIDHRALIYWSNMGYSFDKAGADLMEDVKQSAPFHPDLHTDPQEFIDELLDMTTQSHMGQCKYIVEHIFPAAEELGMNLGNWLNHTTRYKMIEMVPEFRYCLELRDTGEIDAEEFNDRFRYCAAMSTRSISDIRKSKLKEPPDNFAFEEEELADGTWAWYISQLSESSRSWLIRRVQPYGRKIEVVYADRPED